MLIEGAEIDLQGLEVMPGLINAHDHMEFALFPRLGQGPYPNATEWARDIYHPDRAPILEHLQIPKTLRLIWGGLRNLIAGATTVCEHNAYNPVFDGDFPIRVVRRYGWAHSLQFADDIQARYAATPRDVPFVIHAGEGVDAIAQAELAELDRLGVLHDNTVLVHSVAWNDEGWRMLRERGVGVLTCPRSNLFTLGRTLPHAFDAALGTDSALTAEGDLLDEICAARQLWGHDPRKMVTSVAARLLRLDSTPNDYIAVENFGTPPQMVVIGGKLRLISERLAANLSDSQRRQFSSLEIEGRPGVLVRQDIPELMAETRRHFAGPLRLAGREVRC